MLGGGTQQHRKFLPHFSLNKLSFLYGRHWPLSINLTLNSSAPFFLQKSQRQLLVISGFWGDFLPAFLG